MPRSARARRSSSTAGAQETRSRRSWPTCRRRQTPGTFMHWRERAVLAGVSAIAGAASFVVALGGAAEADEIAIEIANASEPTLCAEHDNVTLLLSSANVRRFRIEAVHPAYIGA